MTWLRWPPGLDSGAFDMTLAYGLFMFQMLLGGLKKI